VSEDAHTTAGLETGATRWPIFIPGCERKDHERLFSGIPTGWRRLKAPNIFEVDWMKAIPDALNKMVDAVLAYRPAPKTKAARKRKKAAKKQAMGN